MYDACSSLCLFFPQPTISSQVPPNEPVKSPVLFVKGQGLVSVQNHILIVTDATYINKDEIFFHRGLRITTNNRIQPELPASCFLSQTFKNTRTQGSNSRTTCSRLNDLGGWETAALQENTKDSARLMEISQPCVVAVKAQNTFKLRRPISHPSISHQHLQEELHKHLLTQKISKFTIDSFLKSELPVPKGTKFPSTHLFAPLPSDQTETDGQTYCRLLITISQRPSTWDQRSVALNKAWDTQTPAWLCVFKWGGSPNLGHI